ncbi:MAG: universal stress protein [Deltaproteobacteria bacterium]|nr:universal stress protein [Deltaproteobacteria bacterium]
MDGIKKILAPVDFSNVCKSGVRYALELGRAQGAEVIVYHVIGPAEAWLAKHDEFFSLAELVAEKKQQLAKFLAENFADIVSQVGIREVVDVGVPHSMIVEKAQQEEADIIVMSTFGASGISHMTIGSVTEKVVGRAPCPVLTVRGELAAEPEESLSS